MRAVPRRAPRRRADTVRYRFVGGKGGAGKTTCAAAIGIRAATAGSRVLIVSTDPAPSLGDALAVRLGRRPHRIPLPQGRLFAVEIDAPHVMREWLSTRSSTLREIALRGTWFDRDDVSELLALTLPGIDELAGLLELARFGRSGRYDLIVVDTAPTGHTLRMLEMPDALARVADLFDALQDKHRTIVAALRGRWTPDAADDFVRSLADDASHLSRLIRDPGRTSVTWVSLAERMAVEETLDALQALVREGVHVEMIALNRLVPDRRTGCGFCRARHYHQHAAAADLARRVPRTIGRTLPVTTIADRSTEPIGLPALARVGAALARTITLRPASARSRVVRTKLQGRSSQTPVLPVPTLGRLVLFGGKGGVGKTTCAAAAALTMAISSPAHRILLLSTDPAHSLADVMRTPVSNEPRRIPGGPKNLRVRELDIADSFRRARAEYASAIDMLFERVSGPGLDATHDRRMMQRVVGLAPPGLDELVAILEVTTMVVDEEPRAWDRIVIDTAPTGHALRLLEMPSLIHEWTHALMRIVLKYQPISGAGDLGRLLLGLSRRIAGLRQLLADGALTQFVVVTRPAALPRAETLRLLDALAALGVSAPAVVVNAVGRGECAACRRQAAAERREMAKLTRALRERRNPPMVVAAPAEVPPPQAVAPLVKWCRTWRRTMAHTHA